MKSIPLPACIAVAFAALAAPLSALTETESAAGREVVKRYADAVVGVEMVVTFKLTVSGNAAPPRENKVDVNGTVVAPSGLTVTSLAAIDPRAQFEAMRSMMGSSASRMEVAETDYKEVKLRLADGTEVPARVVLKDADLDLAFIVPEPDAVGAKKDFPCVDLTKAASGAVLGNYFSVSRAPKSLQRVPIVRPSIVVGVVEKPRRLFLVSDQLLGCPMFDPQGRVLGISLQYAPAGRGALVVLPAGDVAEVAAQAAAVKVEPVPAVEPAAPATPNAPETNEEKKP
jgi:S1-C subfamily serine protease